MLASGVSCNLVNGFGVHADLPSWVWNGTYIQGVSLLQGITAGGDFLGLCDKKRSYKHVSDFGRLRSYDRLKLRIEGNDY